MYSLEEHIDNLTRHINLVRDACVLLGKRLINNGETDLGRRIIARGFVHDASKFFGIEWDCLHVGPDIGKRKLEAAISQHVRTNDHHPESSGGVEYMGQDAIGEMVCDWYARAQEFGSDLKDWIESDAVPKYKVKKDSYAYKQIYKFVDLLLQHPFKEA